MQNIIFLFIMGITACSSPKQMNNGSQQQEMNQSDSSGEKLPACIQKMISRFMEEEKQNPPRSIYRYTYQGKRVYYVTPPCCDFFSELYNSDCVLIAQPDGGITGKGDGRAPDFYETRTNEKLIWKDNRK
jgi:hypothetical protein